MRCGQEFRKHSCPNLLPVRNCVGQFADRLIRLLVLTVPAVRPDSRGAADDQADRKQNHQCPRNEPCGAAPHLFMIHIIPSFYLRPLIDDRILQYPAVSHRRRSRSFLLFLPVCLHRILRLQLLVHRLNLLSVQRTQRSHSPIHSFAVPHQPPSLDPQVSVYRAVFLIRRPVPADLRDLAATSRKSQIFQQGGAQVCIYDISGRCARVIPGQLNQRISQKKYSGVIVLGHSPQIQTVLPSFIGKTAAQKRHNRTAFSPGHRIFHLQAGSLRRILFRSQPLICDLLFHLQRSATYFGRYGFITF